MIPLLAGLGITKGVATGTFGIGMDSHLYRKLSLHLVNDIQLVSSTIFNLQKHLDSLAEVVLQNQRGLDVLMAEKDGLCLFFTEVLFPC